MKKFRKFILISDVLSLYLALVLALILRGSLLSHVNQDQSVWLAAHVFIFLPSVLFSILSLYIAGLYDAKTIYDRTKTITLLVYAQLASAVFSIISFYILHTELTPKLTLFLFVIISIFLLSLTRGILYSTISRQKKPGALFVSDRADLLKNLDVTWAPFSVRQIAVAEIFSNTGAIIYDEKLLDANLNILLEKMKLSGVSVYSYNQYYEFLYKKVDLDNMYIGDLLRELGERRETRGHFLVRRSLDIFLSLLIYPIYLVSLPFIHLGFYFQDKGEVYSKQNRVGYLGRQIWLWKFRTMTHTDSGTLRSDDSEKKEGNKMGNKYTKFGIFLRKIRIDELPQCINLFKGEVSFIGPRALVSGVFNEMKTKVPNFELRLLAPQGLTGWAQVHMHYQPKTFEEELEKFAYDLYYIKHRSLFLDFSIILKTVKTILSREGA